MRQFSDELSAAQPALYEWLLRLSAGDRQAAEEVLSRVNLILVAKQDEYDGSRPILPWMRQIAFWQLKAWRTEQRRDRLVLDDDALDAVAACEDAADSRELELRALQACRKELPPEMNELLTRYYDRGERLAEIGRAMRRPAASLANSLCRIRKELRRRIAEKMENADAL